MTSVSMRQMLEAGVHFGHQTRFWNPKMAPFIFGERKQDSHHQPREDPASVRTGLGLHQGRLPRKAARYCSWAPSGRPAIAVQKEAARCNMPYVNQRWLGGMLTNFKTIRQSIKRLNELDEIGAERFASTAAARRRRRCCAVRWTNCCAAWAVSVT